MKYMKKKFVAAGLMAGLAAGAGAGFILEQTGSAGASNASQMVMVTAVPAEPNADGGFDTHVREALQTLVTDGTITEAQLDKIVTALDAARPPRGEGEGDHQGGRGGPGRRGGPGLEVAATALGITADELRGELQSGSSMAEVATAHGVDVQKVIDALVADATIHLDAAVTAGKLTQAEADSKLADLTERITEHVNSVMPEGGPGMGGPGHGGPGMGGPGHGGPGRDGDDDNGAPTDVVTPTTAG